LTYYKIKKAVDSSVPTASEKTKKAAREIRTAFEVYPSINAQHTDLPKQAGTVIPLRVVSTKLTFIILTTIVLTNRI
jgi:hypothetical protein